MTTLCALTILTTLLVPGGTIPNQNPAHDVRVLAAFQQSVAEYLEIHRLAAAGLGDQRLCGDPEELARQSATLAAAIRDARPGAAEGDIFTVPLAAVLRARIAAAVHAARAVPEAIDDAEGIVAVHDAMTGGRWHYTWAPITRALPMLPGELEYQIVGRHLVLVDVRANLVVDVLRYAVPAARAPHDVGPPDPCDVHPGLPACWM